LAIIEVLLLLSTNKLRLLVQGAHMSLVVLWYVSIGVEIRIPSVDSLHSLNNRLQLAVVFIARCLLASIIGGNNFLALLIAVSIHQPHILLHDLVGILLQILVRIIPRLLLYGINLLYGVQRQLIELIIHPLALHLIILAHRLRLLTPVHKLSPPDLLCGLPLPPACLLGLPSIAGSMAPATDQGRSLSRCDRPDCLRGYRDVSRSPTEEVATEFLQLQEFLLETQLLRVVASLQVLFYCLRVELPVVSLDYVVKGPRIRLL
jgi:hypothetical protein